MTKLKVLTNEITTWNSGEYRTHQVIATSSGLTDQLTATTVANIEYTSTIRNNMKKISVTIER